MHIPKLEVLAKGEAWIVRISDADGQHDVAFQREGSARAYAAGQRLRLGLPEPAERKETCDDQLPRDRYVDQERADGPGAKS